MIKSDACTAKRALRAERSVTSMTAEVLALKINARGMQTSYANDDAGRLTGFADPAGTVNYTYDENGNALTITGNTMTSVTDWAGRRTAYTYDANGRLIATTRLDGSIETRTYDVAGQLQEIQDIAADGTILVQDGYSYDAAGNVTAEKNQINQYDENNRLMFSFVRTIKA
jgi:YD repeat-containing protein